MPLLSSAALAVIIHAVGFHTAFLYPRAQGGIHGVKSSRTPIALARPQGETDNSSMKQRTVKKTKPRVQESREDRTRTLAGKTANSKVRSEGRTLVAMERGAEKKRIYEAGRAKKRR